MAAAEALVEAEWTEDKVEHKEAAEWVEHALEWEEEAAWVTEVACNNEVEWRVVGEEAEETWVVAITDADHTTPMSTCLAGCSTMDFGMHHGFATMIP